MVKEDKIEAKVCRYIKLGGRGGWESLCLRDGTMRIGYYEVPHALGIAADRDAIKQIYQVTADSRKASDHARQVIDFYDPSPDVLWVTFADGHLWWAKAAPDVTYYGNDPAIHLDGSRSRRTRDGWHKTSVNGKALRIMDLNGELTKTGAYRGTICDLKPHMRDYVLRKINDEYLPELIDAQESTASLLQAVKGMIAMLHWRDFELLVDLIFSHSGWQRTSVVGDGLKTTDIELLLPVTGERAMVQVKSQTSQAQLDDYIAAFARWDMQRLFYVYHTLNDAMALDVEDPRVTLIGPEKLCRMVLRAGLVEWLMGKAG
ncbi:MAG: hypothetical protein ACOYNL_11210 [Rickettsiales bacterium]